MIVFISALFIGLTSWGISAWLPSFPWYVPFIIAFIAGMGMSNSKGNAFLAGFLGIGVFWLISALLSHIGNDGILTRKMAGMFSSEMGLNVTPIILLIVTPLLGALLGGGIALSGKIIALPGKRFNKHSEMHKRNRRKGSYKLKLN